MKARNTNFKHPFRCIILDNQCERDENSTSHVLQAAMHDDPIGRYLAKDSSYRRFWDVLIDHYMTPARSELNLVTEGIEASCLARIYPDEKVLHLPGSDVTVNCWSLVRLTS